MAISVINSTTYNGRVVGTTGFAVNISGFTLADGDCLFAILGSGDDVGTGWAAVQDGWASLGAASATTGNDAAFGVMRHFIDTASGEPTSITFQRIGNTGTDNFAAIVIQVRGVDPVVPTENAAVEFTVSNDPTPDNVDIETFTDNDAVLVAHLYSDAATVSGSPTLGAPSGYTGITAVTYSDGTNVQGIFMQAAIDTDVGTAGTQSIGSWTTGGSPASTVESYTAAIAIRPEGAPLSDGVYYDRGSKSSPSSSAGTFTWDHDPRNVLSGLVVAVVNHQSASDVITAVKAGGVDMTPISSGAAVDSATEPGRVQTYFLSGSDLPDDDPITIAVTRTGTNNIVGYAAGVYSTTGETDIAGVATISADSFGGTVAGSEQNVNDGSPAEGVSLRLAFGYTGLATPSPAGANSILRQSYDRGANGSSFVTEANPGNGSRPVGFSGAADDYAAVYLAVIPVASEPATVTGDAALSGTGTLTATGYVPANTGIAYADAVLEAGDCGMLLPLTQTDGLVDLSGNGNSGTAENGISVGGVGTGPLAAGDDGATQFGFDDPDTLYVSTPYQAYTPGANRTYMVWVQAGENSNYDAWFGGSTGHGQWIGGASVGGTGDLIFIADAYGDAGVVFWGPAYPLDTWVHWVVAYDGDNDQVSLYKNGSLVSTQDIPSAVQTPSNTDTVEIGSNNSGVTHYTAGPMAWVSVTEALLDATAIADIYAAGITPGPVTGAADLAGSGTLAATGGLEAIGTGALAGVGTLVASGFATMESAADLSGTGTLTAAGFQSVSGASDLGGTGDLGADGAVAVSGAADLDASGTLTATGDLEVIGDLDLTGTGSLAASGIRTVAGAGDLAGAGTFSATGSVAVSGAADLTGSGTFLASGTRTRYADADLASTGTLAATGTASSTGSADLDGTGTLAADGDVEGSVTGTADLTGTGALSATGDHETLGAADLAATGSLVSAGQREVFAIAGLDASGTLAATGEHEATGAAALTGAGTLTADGDVTAGTIHGAAGLTGTGTVTASGLATGTGTATLTGTGTLTATGERIRFAAVSLIASGALAATGEYEAFGVLPLAAVGTLEATADAPLRFGAADLDGIGTLFATAAEVGWTYNADTAATYRANADWSYTGGTAATYRANADWSYTGGTAATYGADTDWSYGGTADLTATYGG